MSEDKFFEDNDETIKNPPGHPDQAEIASLSPELAYKLKLRQALKNKKNLQSKNEAQLKNQKSPPGNKQSLQNQETKSLALRLLAKKKMTLKKELRLGKQGPALTFSGIPVLTEAMILELKAKQQRKERMEQELVEKLQEELKLQMENKYKNKQEPPRKKRKIKPDWI